MARDKRAAGPQGKPLRVEEESAAPDYDLPLDTPTAKELAKSFRPDHFVMTLRAHAEPVVEIFLDQLPAFKGKDDACFVFVISRGKKYRYYKVPFKLVVPMLHWVPLSKEKRPRWRLHLLPGRHKLVGRNGPRVENVDLTPYYNTP